MEKKMEHEMETWALWGRCMCIRISWQRTWKVNMAPCDENPMENKKHGVYKDIPGLSGCRNEHYGPVKARALLDPTSLMTSSSDGGKLAPP